MTSTTHLNEQSQLKTMLQNMDQKDFEHLVATLIGQLLGVHFAISKTGFQHGADAGTSGRQERHLRLECKRYADKTSLSDRELKGELDDALLRDSALETWILAATRDVPEQLEQSLILHGEQLGIPVIIIGWDDNQPATLAALCAVAPDTVATWLPTAKAFAQSLHSFTAHKLEQLKRDLQAWSLGFSATRQHSLTWLSEIWDSRNNAIARFNQDIAGGSTPKKIRRESVHQSLSNWWKSDTQIAAVVGLEGVGKTWAVFNWLTDQQADLPIVLTLSSSVAAKLSSISDTQLRHFLADELYNISKLRSVEFWQQRVHRLLKRPPSEGPVFLLFFDGLNQEPSLKWLELCQLLQGTDFVGKIRVIISSRPLHFEEKLHSLSGFNKQLIEVENYDLTAGGELDQMLAFENLDRTGLHPDLIKLAQVPRLFKLVIHLREQLQHVESITVHRLLWEYGRDSLNTRTHNRSFSEREWCEWLQELATKWRDKDKLNRKKISEAIARADLGPHDVACRLSDLIDGRFVDEKWQPEPILVNHALGLALYTELTESNTSEFEQLNLQLTHWLDPISGLDQRAEILRAAVSIGLEQSPPLAVLDVLMTAWLQTQNLAEAHRQEINRLAPELVPALLTTIEQSTTYTQESSKKLAINALRTIPRNSNAAAKIIFERIDTWLGRISRKIDARNDLAVEQHRAKRMLERVGYDQDGAIVVAGIALTLVTQDDDVLQQLTPSVIEGFPLVNALPIFAKAATAIAINDRCDSWESLKWLCLLNTVDYDETTKQIRLLASDIAQRTAEPSVMPLLPARIGSLLLRLTGQACDEELANQIGANWPFKRSYQDNYLANPAHSFYELERRHAYLTMADESINPASICDKLKPYLADPSLVMSGTAIARLAQYAQNIDIQQLDRSRMQTAINLDFESIEHALARTSPTLLAQMMREKLLNMTSCDNDSAYIFAFHVTNHLLLAQPVEIANVAKQLRQQFVHHDDGERNIAAFQLTSLELLSVSTIQQYRVVIESDFTIYTKLENLLNPLSEDEIDLLVSQYQAGTELQQKNLLCLLSLFKHQYSDSTWDWIISFISSQDTEIVNVVFRALYFSDEQKFGAELLKQQWSWTATQENWVNQFGSRALISATLNLPFIEVVNRIAPWLLLSAIHCRGSKSDELQLVITLYDNILNISPDFDSDPGAIVSIEVPRNHIRPHAFSVSPYRQPQPDDLASLFGQAQELEKWNQQQRDATQKVIAKHQEANAKKAYFYSEIFAADEFKEIVEHHPDAVQRWIEGYQENSTDFRRRVIQAGGFYLALCECLLTTNPPIGIGLWTSLSKLVTTRFIGKADISEWLHIIFRASDSTELLQFREELFELESCNTDLDLFNLALAAMCNNKTEWLSELIKKDHQSNSVWKQKRAIVLEGFMVNNYLPQEEDWPAEEEKTSSQQLRNKAKIWRFQEAFARYWWQQYWQAETVENAYTAWISFLKTADRRAWLWIDQEISLAQKDCAIFELKLKHFKMNSSRLDNQMKKREKDMKRLFLFHPICNRIRPWL